MKRYATLAVRLGGAWLLSWVLATSAWADQQDLDAEIERYSKIFSGTSFGPKKQALSDLAWKGVSDPRVYDPIEAELLAGYQINDKQKTQVEQMSWLAKGLAVSGNMKYATVLEKIFDQTSSKKLKKHVTTALQRLPEYARWNPVIAANLVQAPSGRLNQTRVLNMLGSDVPELIRAGAKIVRKQYTGEADMLAAVNDSLLANYNRNLDNKVQLDAVNHLIRTIGESGMSEYRPTLDKVATSSNKKVAKYAVKYAGYL